jgi:hypothetical protein
MDDPPKAQESAPSATEAAPTSAAREVDADSPAEVRVTFIVLMLAAAGLCALPRQWVSAGILLGLALVGLALHLRAKRQA